MSDASRKSVSSTKILSVRLPAKEAERVDVMAEASGLNRNDYIRLRLKEGASFADSCRIDDVVRTLRGMERMLESYLEQLESLASAARRNGWAEEDAAAIERQLQQGDRLIEELFKAQRKAVQVLDGVRAKVSR